MLLKRRSAHHLTEQDVTPEAVYQDRRLILKGLGLGKLMMEKIVRYARERGIGQLSGMTMPSNRGMINLAKRLGFKIDIQLEDGVVNMELPCTSQGQA